MRPLILLTLLASCLGGCAHAEPVTAPPENSTAVEQPPLPALDGQVTLHVQDGPGKAPRDLVISIWYSRSRLATVTEKTGLMLDLHNWGGMDLDGAASPSDLINNYDVIAIAVRYYQSGDKGNEPEPYDFGYLQAWDALRALHYVYSGLEAAGIPFDKTRIYGAGGSGGGNVIEMANKFAPHTFACIVDLSGMPSLTDDIAYGLPGGSGLSARYSRDPNSPAYLTKGMQEVRDLGNPAHLAAMAKGGSECTIVRIHGLDDGYCLADDAKRVVAAQKDVGLKVEAHFIGKDDIDGTLVRDSGHSVGERTALLNHFAGDYLKLDSPQMLRLKGKTDFERKGKIVYETTGERFIMDYKSGSPELRSEKVK